MRWVHSTHSKPHAYQKETLSLFTHLPIRYMVAWMMWKLSRKPLAGCTRIWNMAALRSNSLTFIHRMDAVKAQAINMCAITRGFTNCVPWSFASRAFMDLDCSVWKRWEERRVGK